MFGAPSIVPGVGCRALIAPVSYVQWLQVVVGGLSIGQAKDSVKRLFCGRNFLAYRPRFPSVSRRTAPLLCAPDDLPIGKPPPLYTPFASIA